MYVVAVKLTTEKTMNNRRIPRGGRPPPPQDLLLIGFQNLFG